MFHPHSNVKDINSVLEVTVYDEDRDHRFEFLGAVHIPLLRITNGQKRWYTLKDRKLRSRAKGSNPQILLELSVVWNEVNILCLPCIRLLYIYIACFINGIAPGHYTNTAAQGEEIYRTGAQIQPTEIRAQRDANQECRHGHDRSRQIYRVPHVFITFCRILVDFIC